jgi:hypothetical protein
MYGAEVLGISVDRAWCHKAFAEHRSIHFPLLSDFEPKGEVAKSYGANRYTQGVCERVLFVIDKDGVFFWSICRGSTPAPMAFSMLSKGCNRRSGPPPGEGLLAEWSKGRRNAKKGEVSWLP